MFTIYSKTHQRSTLNKWDQPYTIEINSTHSGPTLDVSIPSRWLTKDSSPKNSQTNSSIPDLVQNSCSLHDYIAVYDSGLQVLDAGGDLSSSEKSAVKELKDNF